MSAMNNFSLVRGQPFEHEWPIDYSIFDEDKLDSTIEFKIYDSNNNNVLNLSFNYGMTIIQFDGHQKSNLVISIFDTDVLSEGEYTFSYDPQTFSGRKLEKIFGTISVSSPTEYTPFPNQKREVRPWDLLRSKAPGAAGERASDEDQEKRMSICEACPRFVKLTSQCLECGCIMKLKTKLAAATCPLGKW